MKGEERQFGARRGPAGRAGGANNHVYVVLKYYNETHCFVC